MNTNKRLQSALELLSTYGFMLALAAIVLIAITYFVSPLQQVQSNSCTTYGGIACSAIEYYSNTLNNNANIIVYLSNAESVPINVITINVIIGGNTYNGICTTNPTYPSGNTFVNPASGFVCSTQSPLLALKPGSKVQGQFYINLGICNSEVTQLTQANCNFLNVQSAGSFVAYSSYKSSNPQVSFNIVVSNAMVTGSSSVMGDHIGIFYCPGTSCEPITFLASNSTSVSYSLSSLPAGTYTVRVCDTTQYSCSSSNTVTIAGCYLLSLINGPGGSSVSASPSNSVGCSSGKYNSGAAITLTATPASGSTFSSWTGTLSSSSNPWSYSMPASTASETANYGECYQLALTDNPGGASISSSPLNSAGCTPGNYMPNAVITLTATPSSGYIFTGWSGTYSTTSNPWSFPMPSSQASEAANYNICYQLTLTDGAGGSGVSESPSNSVGCTPGNYFSGTAITLTATPSSGYAFTGWTGTSSNSLNPWSYTMPASTASETANYAQCYQLTLTDGTGGSSVAASPSNSIGCSSGYYISGAAVTLTATPASGYTFSSWTGTSSSSSNPWSYSMPASTASETANYASSCTGTNTLTVNSYLSLTVPASTTVSYTMYGGGGGGGGYGAGLSPVPTAGYSGALATGSFSVTTGSSMSVYVGGGGGGGGGESGCSGECSGGGGGGSGYYGGGGGSTYSGGSGGGGGSSVILINGAIANSGNAYASGGAGGTGGGGSETGGGGGTSSAGGSGGSLIYSGSPTGGSLIGGQGSGAVYAGISSGGSGSSGGAAGGGTYPYGGGGGGGGGYGSAGGNGALGAGGSSGSGAGTGGSGNGGSAAGTDQGGSGGAGGSVTLSWPGSSCPI